MYFLDYLENLPINIHKAVLIAYEFLNYRLVINVLVNSISHIPLKYIKCS